MLIDWGKKDINVYQEYVRSKYNSSYHLSFTQHRK